MHQRGHHLSTKNQARKGRGNSALCLLSGKKDRYARELETFSVKMNRSWRRFRAGGSLGEDNELFTRTHQLLCCGLVASKRQRLVRPVRQHTVVGVSEMPRKVDARQDKPATLANGAASSALRSNPRQHVKGGDR